MKEKKITRKSFSPSSVLNKIWRDKKTFPSYSLSTFIRNFFRIFIGFFDVFTEKISCNGPWNKIVFFLLHIFSLKNCVIFSLLRTPQKMKKMRGRRNHLSLIEYTLKRFSPFFFLTIGDEKNIFCVGVPPCP